MEDERTTRGGQTSSRGSGGTGSSSRRTSKSGARGSRQASGSPETLPDRFAFSAGRGRKSTAKKSTAKSAAKPAAKTTAKKSTAKAPTAKAATAKKTTAKRAAAKKTTAKAPTRTRAAARPTVAAPQETPTEAVPRPAVTAPAPSTREAAESFAAAAGTRAAPPTPAPPAPAPTPTLPEREPPRRRRFLMAIVVLAVLAAVVWAIVYLAGRGKTPTPAASTPSVGATTPSSSPPSSPAVTTASADFPGTASADAATLQVVPLAPKDAKCTTHTVGGTAAYVSDCADWGDRASVLYFFYVTLQNKSSDSLDWRRSAFSVTSGTDYQPVEVRKQAADPTTFLPKKGTIGSQDSVSGYLAFQIDGPFDPASLQYERGGLTLTIQFVGATAEVPAGS